MSSKSVFANGECFIIYSDAITGGIYLELQTSDIEVFYKNFMAGIKVQLRIPKELTDRLLLDGKSIPDEPSFA